MDFKCCETLFSPAFRLRFVVHTLYMNEQECALLNLLIKGILCLGALCSLKAWPLSLLFHPPYIVRPAAILDCWTCSGHHHRAASWTLACVEICHRLSVCLSSLKSREQVPFSPRIHPRHDLLLVERTGCATGRLWLWLRFRE